MRVRKLSVLRAQFTTLVFLLGAKCCLSHAQICIHFTQSSGCVRTEVETMCNGRMPECL